MKADCSSGSNVDSPELEHLRSLARLPLWEKLDLLELIGRMRRTEPDEPMIVWQETREGRSD